MSPEYIHWAKAPFELDRKYFYDPVESRRFFKPFGLWFEVDGDWQRWCDSERFRPEGFHTGYAVEFVPNDVLFLPSAHAIDAFSARYRMPRLESYRMGMELDWPRVANDYAGIVIAPYCWERRMSEHTMWYYGFDVACGCIWDLSIITRFEQIPSLGKLPDAITEGELQK